MGTIFHDIDFESSVTIDPSYKNGEIQLNETVIDHLKSHVSSIQNFKQDSDNSILNMECIKLTTSKINDYLDEFKNNYGKFLDGSYIRVTGDVKYFKFTSNLSLVYEDGIAIYNDDNPLFTLAKMNEKGALNLPTLDVFIDGKKIPDDEIKLYMGKSSTELLIPISYLTLKDESNYNPCTIYIEKKDHRNHDYYTKHITYNTGTIELTDVNENFVLDSVVNAGGNKSCRQIFVFANNLLKSSSDYSVDIESGNKVVLNLGSSFGQTDNIEVTIEAETIVRTEDTCSMSKGETKTYFCLHEADDKRNDLIHGSVPKGACAFYIDHKRIPIDDITQISRMIYLYDNGSKYTSAPVTDVIYFDKDEIDDTKMEIYGDDYYIANILGNENLAKCLFTLSCGKSIVGKEYSNDYIISKDDELDLLKISTYNDTIYNYDNSLKLANIENGEYTYNEQAIELIKGSGNYLIRDLLNLYTKNDIFQTVVKEDLAKDVTEISFSFKTKKDLSSLTEKFYYSLNINGKHIGTDDYQVINRYQYAYIVIPVSLLSSGKNRIHIRETKYDNKVKNIIETIALTQDDLTARNIASGKDRSVYEEQIAIDEAKIAKLDETEDAEEIESLEKEISEYQTAIYATYKYAYTFDAFTTATSLSDYCLIKKIMNNDENSKYYFKENSDYGWIIDEDVVFMENEDGTITMLTDGGYTYDIEIYCKRFSFKFHTITTENITELQDMILPIIVPDVAGLPVIPNGSYSVFLNGEKLYNGIDYVIKHPENYKLITYSGIIFKRKMQAGDSVDIYFDKSKNLSVGYSDNIVSHEGIAWDKYGLIYFGKLDYPYSPKYVDLYINGKYIHPDQIDIISDNLIRVDPEILNPMYDIFAETAFDVDVEKISNLFSLNGYTVERSDFEKKIASLFSNYDFSTLVNPTPDVIDNTIYASFDDNVDTFGHIANYLRDEDLSTAESIAEELVPLRYDLFENAFLLWLHSNYCKTIIDPTEDIEDDILNHFELYVDEQSTSDRNDVVINTMETSVFDHINFDDEDYPYSYSERLYYTLLYLAEGDGVELKYDEDDTDYPSQLFQTLYANLLNYSNIIYPDDIPTVIESGMDLDIEHDIVIGGSDIGSVDIY